MKKKSLFLFLFFISLFVLVSCNEENNIDNTINENENQNKNEDYYDWSEDWESRPIPSNFDLRSVDTNGDGIGDRCYVTPVRCQNPFGTCWGFAAIAASEISILGSIYKNDPDAYKYLNLSEKQIAYFSHMPNPITGEGLIPNNPNDMSEIYNSGSSFLATSTFAQGIGPSNEASNEYFEYHGNDKIAVQRNLGNGYELYSYSELDDWTIPEDYRFYRDYTLLESIVLDNPAIKENGKYKETDLNAILEIKKQLLQKRGVEIAIKADTASPSQDSTEPGIYISTKNYAHYTWDDSNPTHAVTIVGWDDNYSKDNFLEGHKPEKDGAFLCKNSWGTGERDFPNKLTGDWGFKVPMKDENGNVMYDDDGNVIMVASGYFWVSYYDHSLSTPEAFVFTDDVSETIINQYDYMPINGVSSLTFSAETGMANVFMAEQTQLIEGISCQLAKANLTVDYKIYLLNKNYSGPTDGKLVFSKSEKVKYGGFHRFDNEDILVQKGQYYSVIMSIKDDDGLNYLNVPYGIELPLISTSYAKMDERQSYLLMDGNWNDYKDNCQPFIDRIKSTTSLDVNVYIDNFPIKTYSKPVDGNIYYNVVQTNPKLAVGSSDTTDLVLTIITPDNIKNLKGDIKWEILSGEDIIELKPKNGERCEIKALKAGTALVTVTFGEYGTQVFKFEIKNLYISSATTLEPKKVYTGLPIEPNIIVFSNITSLMTKDVDYTVSYSNNLKCGIGKAEVTPTLGHENPDILEPLKVYYAIIPNKAAITQIEGNNDSMTINVLDLWDSGITGYKVQIKKAGIDIWEDYYILNNETSITISNLEYGQYDVKVSAYIDTSSFEKNDNLLDLYYGEEDLKNITLNLNE